MGARIRVGVGFRVMVCIRARVGVRCCCGS